MNGVVYADVLVLLNAIVGYFLLRCTARFASFVYQKRRVCLAAFLAGLSALQLLWQSEPWPLAVFTKLVCGGLIVLAAFPWEGARGYIKGCLWYFAFNIGLGGLTALAVLAGAQNLYFENFSLYVHVSPLLLIVCVLVMYGAVQLGAKIFGGFRPSQRMEFCACMAGTNFSGMALLDTGQEIRDSFTGTGAVLCSFAQLKGALPVDTRAQLEAYFAQRTIVLVEPRLHLIPIKTATGTQALPALRAEVFRLPQINKAMLHPLLVFTPERLGDGTVCALFNPAILQEMEQK